MEPQTIFNVLLGGIGTLIVWIMNQFKDDMADIKKKTTALQATMQAHEVYVARAYVTRAELRDSIDNVTDKLDAIFNRLEGKADKHRG